MSLVKKCPECDCPRRVRVHCDSKTCSWWWCSECEHAFDDGGRHFLVRKPKSGGMLV